MHPYRTNFTIEQLRERYRKPERRKKAKDREKISKIDGFWPWEHQNTPHREKYRTYMASPFWLVRERECRRLAGHICANCQSRRSRLTVHHLQYRNLFHEPQEDLICLCWPCHQRAENHGREMRALHMPQTRESVLAFLADFRRDIEPSKPKRLAGAKRAAQSAQDAEINGWFIAFHSHT